MRKSTQFAVAGVGLIVAASFGFLPALASDGSSVPLTDEPQPTLEVSPSTTQQAESTESNIQIAGAQKPKEDKVDEPTSPASTTPKTSNDEASTAENPASTDKENNSSDTSTTAGTVETKDESETEASVPGTSSKEVAPTTENTTPAETPSDSSETPSTVSEESPVPVSPQTSPTNEATNEGASSETSPNKETPTTETEAKPEDTATTDIAESATTVKQKEQAQKEAQAVAAAEALHYVAPVVIPRATVSIPENSSTSTATPTVDLGPTLALISPSVTSGSEEAQTLAVEPGAATANGQTAVIWFELPPAEGTGLLKPGQATPLLGSSIVESRLNTSQDAVQIVTTGHESAKAAAIVTKPAKANPIINTLAKTGSTAQAMMMVSGGVLIIGLGLLLGAFAAKIKSRR